MNKSEKFSLIISLIAIVIAFGTLYFQFFYEKYEIRLSVIDSEINYSVPEIETKIVYHNSGNIFTTITQNYLIFYQDKDDYHNKGIKFSNISNDVFYKEIYDPIVLKPGEQKLKALKTKYFFNKVDFNHFNIDKSKEINVGIIIGFLNNDGLQTNELIELGWIKLDSLNNIDKFHFDFTNRKLQGYGYFSSVEN